MPGSFSFQPSHPQSSAAPPRLSGAKSHIFHPPPRTPSVSASSSLILTRSTTSSSSARPNAGSRKRSRTDYNAGGNDTPMMEDWSTMANTMETPGSPMSFVNTRYLVKGGMDTPSLAVEQAHESEYSDITYRKSLSGNEQRVFGEPSYFPLEQLEHESNGRPRVPQYHSPGWNIPKTALEVVGGVVGKVWEFCKTSAFRGFHAGGGKGYTITSANTATNFQVREEDSFWETEKTPTWGLGDRESTPVPGQFPQDLDFIPDYMDHPSDAEATPPRPSKRRQISGNNGEEIGKNWVVVPPTATQSPSRIPTRGPARYTLPTTSSASRRSTTGRPASRAGGAAGMGGRRPVSRISHAGSPALQSNRGASFAPSRSPAANSKLPRASTPTGASRINNGVVKDSPAAIEAQRWAAVKKKEEREADESIRRLDRQLKAMIREGKEALGTKIEVEIDDDYSDSRAVKKWAI